MTEGLGLLDSLRQLENDCQQVQGAVLATDDGLVLAASGCLCTDAAAASAAHLAENVEQNLSLVASTTCAELLVWSPTLVWYLTRLPGQCVLMVCASPDCHAGELRLAASDGARRLAALVAMLGVISAPD
jgi:predicted regulator of Ras-like GTPase activity (Roadblock/LC7/MglB family)